MVSVYYRIEIKVGALQTSCVPLMVGWCGTEVGVGLILFLLSLHATGYVWPRPGFIEFKKIFDCYCVCWCMHYAYK